MRRWLAAAASFALITFTALAAVTFISKLKKPISGADAIIVLGCGLNGSEVSTMLRLRLDAALEYYRLNPEAVILTSGGQGPDEPVSEAYAMRNYLVRHGVPEDAILMEDRSSSTKENLFYSKALLDRHFVASYKVAVVTSDFHILRSSLYAAQAGIESAEMGAGRSVGHLLPGALIREYMALLGYYLNPGTWS